MLTDEDVLDIARKLRIAGNAITRDRDANAARVGLTSGQADALYFIGRNSGCRIKDLKGHMGSSHQAACGVTERLEAKKLISVSMDSADARARRLTLTREGTVTLNAYLELGVQTNSVALEDISEEEIETLRRCLDSILIKLSRRRWSTQDLTV